MPRFLSRLIDDSKSFWIFIVLVSFAFWGVRPLWDPDEARYAEVSREMLSSGDWLIPHLGDVAHLTKPPMTYWITAVGMKAFGVNAWGARFFLCFSFLGIIASAVELARCWGWSGRESRSAGIVLATSVLSFVCGHALTTDNFLTCAEVFGALCLWKVWTSAPRTGLWRLGFWFAFGIAFLTKGPPGWIPLLAAMIFSWRFRRTKPGAGIFSWMGFALFVVVSASWYLAVILQDPSRFQHFVVDEFINRVATTSHNRNNPFFIYPPVILGGAIPWLWLWPSGWRMLAKARRESFLTWSEPARFSLIWFVTGFIIFTLARSRLPLYVVPIFVILAMWEGKILANFNWEGGGRLARWGRRSFRFLAGAWLLLMAAVPGLPPQFRTSKSRPELGKLLQKELGDSAKEWRLYWVGGHPPKYSVAFYSGMPLTYLTEEYEKAPGLAVEKMKRGVRPVLLIRNSRTDKLRVELSTFGRVVHDDKYSAIIVDENWRAPK